MRGLPAPNALARSGKLAYAPGMTGASHVSAARRRNHILWLCLIVILLAYHILPIIAGMRQMGDRRGPRIYPENIHAILYLIGWEAAGHEGKPRAGPGMPPRPWFYERQSP